MKVKIRYVNTNENAFSYEDAMIIGGQNAAMCYMKNNFNDILGEDPEKSIKRAYACLKRGHHSVIEHINVSLLIEDMPKMLADRKSVV